MKFKCQKCSHVYEVDEKKLPDTPVLMRCMKCEDYITLGKKPQNETKKVEREKINHILENIDDLPTLPTVANHIIQLTGDKNSSSVQISELIAQDQSLTTRVLKIVNSAFYGFPRKITTINHAVVILGTDEIKNLVLGTSILKAFPDSKKASGFKREEFWVHSIGCGVASKMLAKTFQYRVTGEVFVAGLIHDIGKIVLDQYLNTEFGLVLKEAQEKKVSLFETENEILGIAHTHVGKILGEKWKLPKSLTDVIYHHHNPLRSEENQEIVSLVYFGNILCRMAQIGLAGGDEFVPTIDSEVWDLLKNKKPDLNDSYIDKFIYDLKSEMDNTQGLLGILKEKKEVAHG